jgi:alpha-D-ribose 1-methylphosphonate 5-triphosphate synthase subunit PhnH
MLVPIHRAVSAVLHVMLVAFVTISARVQHGVLRSKHWFTIAPTTAAVALVLARPDTWAWLAPNTWAW